MRSCLSHRVNERCVIIRGATFCLLIRRRAKMGPSRIALLLLCGWSRTLRHKVSLEASSSSSTHRSVASTLLLVSLIIQIAESVQILSMPFLSQVTTPSFGPMTTHELLHHMTGKGLSAKYQFPRQPCLYQPSMVAVQVLLSNNSDHCLEKIHIGETSPASLSIHCFNTIGQFTLHMCKIIPSQLTKELQPLINPLNKSSPFIKPRRYRNF